MHKPKAVALISGGLDSMLATKLILDQGIHVEGINFYTGFCIEGHTSAIRSKDRDKPKRNNALWVAEQLNIPLHIIDIVEEYKQVLLKPKYGYGANLNPCLDCKIFMVKKAKVWMEENHFDFIITGEVLGQRPKSQTRKKFPIIAEESGAFDKLLRPLCAKNLAPTYPEKEGWIKRELLKDFTGRSRTPQFELAESMGISEYAQPAGGCCFLTNEHYSAKLKDLWQHRGTKEYELDDIVMLKVGRHIRPKENFKLIVGRDEGENNYLEGYRKQFLHMRALEHQSPLVLIDGEVSAEDIYLSAQITARFSDGKHHEKVKVKIVNLSGTETEMEVKPLHENEVLKEWYV